MNIVRRWREVAVIAFTAAAVVWAAAYTSAGDEIPKEIPLFFGTSVVDTIEQASPWIDVRGANRVMIRTVSNRSTAVGGFGTTDADTLYSDSISVFRVLFSDSVSFMGRDSLGTLVTANSAIPATSSHGPIFPVCADSVMLDLTTTTRTDTLSKQVQFSSPPDLQILRPAANGSGIYTWVTAVAPASIATYGDGSIGAKYMRIRYQALRRSTVATWAATAPNRVRGTKNLRMWALVFHKNR